MAKSTKKKTDTKENKVPLLWSGALKGPPHSRNTLSLHDPWVIGFEGHRGAGKTLSMAVLGAKAMAAGIPVWSNVDIEFDLADRYKPGEIVRYKSLPLDKEAFYRLDSDVSSGILIWDEIQYAADSRTSGRLSNRILAAGLRQVRKRTLSLFYTCHDLESVDKRLRYETDLQIVCQDMALTPWGLTESDLNRGEMIMLTVIDVSGAATGTPWYKYVREYGKYRVPESVGRHRFYLYGKAFWGIYDTHAVIDVFDEMRRVRVDLDDIRIDMRRDKTDNPEVQGIVRVIEMLREAGYNEVSTKDFWATAGLTTENARHYGRYLKDLGITKRELHGGKALYVLSGYNPNGGAGRTNLLGDDDEKLFA